MDGVSFQYSRDRVGIEDAVLVGRNHAARLMDIIGQRLRAHVSETEESPAAS